jgi:hypothetical protein
MTFFNPTVPIFRKKQWQYLQQDQDNLYLRIKIQDRVFFTNIYTCIDQVFVMWGLIAAAIFITGQFAPISWIAQAITWTVLTLIGTVAMWIMTYTWVKRERLRWLLYVWVFLMLLGVGLTDAGVFLIWPQILMYLCHLWLGLSAIGYFLTAIGMRSRAFIIAGMLHLLGIAMLPWISGWQFLTTGLIMVANLFIFAETQWDDYGC